jgi:hypothetical protein
MAEIESLTFSITRTSFPDGHICSLEYSYYLYTYPEQYVHDDTFSISVELHGDEPMHDKKIGEPIYDSHVIDKKTRMPVTRKFSVPCEVLDEAWGKDHIYLRLYVISSGGEILTEDTATISDWF